MPESLSRKLPRLLLPVQGGSIYGSENRPARPDYVIDEATGCWDWAKGLTPQGYPSGPKKYGIHKPHRIYFYLATGQNPNGHHVHHVCHNRACVNPAHLELRTAADHFEEHGREKRVLTDEEGAELRRLCAEPGLTYEAIAERFGVSPQQVADLALGHRWAGQYKGMPPVKPLRLCVYCGEQVPVERRRTARYCDSSCKASANYRVMYARDPGRNARYQRERRQRKAQGA